MSVWYDPKENILYVYEDEHVYTCFSPGLYSYFPAKPCAKSKSNLVYIGEFD